MDIQKAGAIVLRTAQLKWGRVEEGREWARRITDIVNDVPNGVEVLAYEEHFGDQNRLHWIFMYNDLADYNDMRSATHTSETFLAAANPKVWGDFFEQSTITDRVLQPIELLGEAAAG